MHSSTKPANLMGQDRHAEYAAIGPSDEPSDGNASVPARAVQQSYRSSAAARERLRMQVPRLQVLGPGAGALLRAP